MDRHIYLDNNATTALDPRVLEAMLPFMAQAPLNPSSAHAFGRQAKSALNWARSTISGVLGCYPDEILFTSGGTEALNLLLRSLHRAQPHGHWVSTDLEHAAVYETLRSLEQAGAPVTFLSPGPWGAAKTEEVEAACRAGTFALALMGVNNETGVRTDVAEMAALARRKDLFFVVDGVAWLGKEPLRLYEGVSAMAFSAHKLHGPKGVGFAYVKRGFPLKALHTGGGQEGGMRGGTEPLAAIVGLAKAVELLASELPQAGLRMALLRDRLEAGIQADRLVVFGG